MKKVDQIHQRVLSLGWWSGIFSFIFFFVGLWLMMGFIPPPPPTLTGEELIANYLKPNPLLFKGGIVLCIISGGLLMPWGTMVCYHISRTEAGHPPILAVIAFCGMLGNAIFTLYPFTLWAGAFYRAERDPAMVQMINDITWLEFVMMFPPFVLFLVALGIAGLNSTAKEPVIPRWFAFFTLWVAVAMCPGGISLFFFEGPFAWNGLLAWWLVVIMFGIYWLTAFKVFRDLNKSDFPSQRA